MTKHQLYRLLASFREEASGCRAAAENRDPLNNAIAGNWMGYAEGIEWCIAEIEAALGIEELVGDEIGGEG